MFDRDVMTKMLAEAAPFADFSKSELKAVGQVTELRKLNAGDELTRQGQFGSELIVVLTGSASVDISGTKVTELGPGEVIGEMSFLDHGPRTATIIATTPMDIGVLTIKGFEDVAKQSPGLWRLIAVGLARRLREADKTFHH